MTRLEDHFLIRNYEEARSFDDVMITGKNYRITILSEVLVRLEYSKEGKFEDRPTELVTCRRFNSPKFFIKNEKEYLTISTNYFKLEYQKEKPFYGTKLAPDINLRITLNNSDKIWFFGCAEARNFNGTSYSFNQNQFILYLMGIDDDSMVSSKPSSEGGQADAHQYFRLLCRRGLHRTTPANCQSGGRRLSCRPTCYPFHKR